MELSKADAKNVVLFIFSLRDTIRSISFAHNVGIVNRQIDDITGDGMGRHDAMAWEYSDLCAK